MKLRFHNDCGEDWSYAIGDIPGFVPVTIPSGSTTFDLPVPVQDGSILTFGPRNEFAEQLPALRTGDENKTYVVAVTPYIDPKNGEYHVTQSVFENPEP